MKRNIGLLVYMLLLSPILSAQSVRTFIKFTGGIDIAGESVVSGYTEYIEIYGFNYNFSIDQTKPNTVPVSGSLSFQKPKSKSSPKFFICNTTGTHFTAIEIKFVKQGGQGGQQLLNFMTYKFATGFVTSIADKNDFSEEINIAVRKAWVGYKPTLQPSGTLGNPISYGWDFFTNTTWTNTF